MDSTPDARHRRLRRWAWITVALLVVATLVAVVVPGVLIHPFHPQTARDVRVSFALRRAAWFGAPVTAALVAAAAVYLFRGARWYARAGLLALVVLMGATAWFARQMPFEWMFHPLPGPQYARAGDARWVGDGDAVMAVSLNGESVAYPVRQMAYHHIVHDVVGGVPLVVTY